MRITDNPYKDENGEQKARERLGYPRKLMVVADGDDYYNAEACGMEPEARNNPATYYHEDYVARLEGELERVKQDRNNHAQALREEKREREREEDTRREAEWDRDRLREREHRLRERVAAILEAQRSPVDRLLEEINHGRSE
jgi:hypothetical protein